MKKLYLIFLLFILFLKAYPQRSADIGILGGAAAYWGDMENVDYTKSVFSFYGVSGRWNYNDRISFRGQLVTGSLGATGTFPSVYLAESGSRVTLNDADGIPYDAFLRKSDESYNFERSYQSIEAVFEFNFMDYKMGNTKKERFTPYISLGAGAFYSRAPRTGTLILMPQVESVLVPYNNLYRPVMDSDRNLTNGSDALAPFIPVGFGIKYNLTKKLGASMELCIRKTFTDNIDNLKDPQRYQTMEPIVGAPVDQFVPGVLVNNDWYGSIHVSLHWQIWSDRGICKMVEDKNSKKGKKSAF